MKKSIVSLLLASTMIMASPLTALAEEVSDEELANEEAESIAEEVVTDNRIIPKGISIGGTDVSGKTVTEAEDVVNNYFSDYDSAVFTLSANGQTFTATGADLCIGAKNADVLEKAATYGTSGNFAERYKASKDLEEGRGKDFPLSLGADRAGIELFLSNASSQVNDDASDDYLTRENGQFVFHEGRAGVVVQIAESASALQNYIENNWDGGDTTFELVTEVK
ncbi:MAG: peptidoglycan binding domain-containing protein, partial [Pseudobutyrivibrio sp.]|nr:peptidoglycan binding domain-containing protein [Pseudobutyrivibrio sp.]